MGRSKEEVLAAEAEEVLYSRPFRETRVSKRILEILASRCVSGTPGAFDQYSLAQMLYGSVSTSDTGRVRIAVREVRRRLDEYYCEEGFRHRERLDIPKGQYRLRLTTWRDDD